jgi:hypothetical protein
MEIRAFTLRSLAAACLHRADKWVSVLFGSQWLRRAIRITIGIGTPRSKSKIERIWPPYKLLVQKLNRQVIALLSTDGTCVACTECATQQRYK